jgi:hypothetical protein
MGLVDQICAIGKIAPAVHRDYRPVFESGSTEQLMRFLAMGNVPRDGITRVSESTDIPINTIRCRRHELLQSPNWRPYACARLPEGRAFSVQQELDLTERLRAEYVSVDQDCLPATVDYLALAMNAESWVAECDAPHNVDLLL